ncbi:hypothetical protein VFPFJ_11531 [Purpureocillium lilacinum]|uniref:Uncharacterized protein n=1 Tax=Purpureocillium lilacinum TaxID=33203 RepID=A0A179GGJ9_PURLI|nr:hypothetical protein VFPFJ_11531 [Purpureocillium lilacinum]OAQ60093.1 hypothetical protein VFPFJ_11531 [Purpureocillium lilacinum]OAQ76965.1 hypothetical protein VFPBJ_07437 [Purpureocillium lilacinum]PWI67001.1 hypothetical protein PCL_04507 [Purpureocillium lilacinum]GJN85467.1 hypothetical protein PLIIFM63780_009034 [Purpureocillium lilacinum]
MSSGRSGSVSSKGSNKSDRPQAATLQLIEGLTTHRINTLTELCRIERIAAACQDEADARAFQQPMTAAWIHYVTSHQLLTELRGLTPSFPFSGEVVRDAYTRVRVDPDSNRSWNLAWLCLRRMRDDGLLRAYAAREAARPEMWAGGQPAEEEVLRLAACFEGEWVAAVDTMLRHWHQPPAWY